MKNALPIWLASRSPRRRQLLAEAGWEIHVRPPDIDDAMLRPGSAASPEAWVASLAYLKARRVADELRRSSDRAASGIVLGADTLCVAGHGELLGQPRNQEDARRMLNMLRGGDHQTITGLCLLWLDAPRRLLLHDSAIVRIGALSDEQIDEYLASGEWRGKAGAYNLSERVEAGWPIECLGDPTTVMGLPMQRLKSLRELIENN